MGQKVQPTGFRLGITENWRSRWYAEKDYAKTLGNDLEIRKYLEKRLSRAALSRVEIERAGDKVKVTILTARPGIVIGKKGSEIDALRAEEAHWITNRQIEAARIAMTRYMKRGGKVWITIFPDKPITKKPAETRMGSGKGNPEEWVAVVKPGRIMFEITGVSEEVAKEALRLAQHKMPIKTKIVARADQAGEDK